MSEIDWNNVLEYVIPIIVVLVAGLIAVYKMKQNIKLEGKIKRKEEFRNSIKEINRHISKLGIIYGTKR